MLNKEVEKAFNQQINAEAYSAYLYMSMGAWCEKRKLPGLGHWMIIQAQEELSHTMLFYRYVVESGGQVGLSAIEAPPTTWESALACVQHVLSHERHVTGLIDNLLKVCRAHNEPGAAKFLQWFVDEQEEEEEAAEALVQKVKAGANSPLALHLLERELKERVFHMPGNLVL